jgi:hypothetical protein
MPPAHSSSIRTSGWTEIWKNRALVSLFALLFFLCSADQFFAVRINGFNVRFGQILLFVCAFISLIKLREEKKKRSENWNLHVSILKNWLPFFMFYVFSAGISATAEPSFLKLGWALFNIGGAVLICLNQCWNRFLINGFFYGIVAIASILWVQWILIYVFEMTVPDQSVFIQSQPLIVPWLHYLPVGYVQSTMNYFGGILVLRPNAFYYEPSYAGCALAFSLPLVIALGWRKGFLKGLLAPSIILIAIILTSSRGGILCVCFIFLFAFLGCWILKEKKLLIFLLKIIFLASLLIGPLFLFPSGRNFMGFMLGPLGPSAAISRLGDPRLSEGGRLTATLGGLHLWEKHFLFGNGISLPANKNSQGLGQETPSMWVEIGMESGLLGVGTFLLAVLKTLYDSIRTNRNNAIKILIISAVTAHGLINMNFTATFPRLDYWLLFFLAINLCNASYFKSSNESR